eukprot:m.79978 g.79978  ORF g.79978 m.79978 type:complete len:785 (-) comp10859_c0_seq1:67-2421(-)
MSSTAGSKWDKYRQAATPQTGAAPRRQLVVGGRLLASVDAAAHPRQPTSSTPPLSASHPPTHPQPTTAAASRPVTSRLNGAAAAPPTVGVWTGRRDDESLSQFKFVQRETQPPSVMGLRHGGLPQGELAESHDVTRLLRTAGVGERPHAQPRWGSNEPQNVGRTERQLPRSAAPKPTAPPAAPTHPPLRSTRPAAGGGRGGPDRVGAAPARYAASVDNDGLSLTTDDTLSVAPRDRANPFGHMDFPPTRQVVSPLTQANLAALDHSVALAHTGGGGDPNGDDVHLQPEPVRFSLRPTPPHPGPALSAASQSAALSIGSADDLATSLRLLGAADFKADFSPSAGGSQWEDPSLPRSPEPGEAATVEAAPRTAGGVPRGVGGTVTSPSVRPTLAAATAPAHTHTHTHTHRHGKWSPASSRRGGTARKPIKRITAVVSSGASAASTITARSDGSPKPRRRDNQHSSSTPKQPTATPSLQATHGSPNRPLRVQAAASSRRAGQDKAPPAVSPANRGMSTASGTPTVGFGSTVRPREVPQASQPPKATPQAGAVGAERQRPQTGGRTASRRSRSGHVDDLELLEVQLLQWSFLCTRAETAFAQQEAEASGILHGVFRQVQGMKAAMNDAAVELATLEHAKRVDTVLDAMEGGVVQLGSLVPTLKLQYARLADAVRATTDVLPTTGVSVDESAEAIDQAIATCAAKLEGATAALHEAFPSADVLAARVAELRAAVDDEVAAVAECSARLDAVAQLEVQERSLKAQQQQLDRLLRERRSTTLARQPQVTVT